MIRENEFQPAFMHKGIVFCALRDCTRAATCLRYLTYKHSAPFCMHRFLDMRYQKRDNQCSEYVSNVPVQMAKGFRKAKDLLPHGKMRLFRWQVCQALECGRSNYYEYARGKFVLTPAQQQQVKAIFVELGVELKEYFDSYVTLYDLDW